MLITATVLEGKTYYNFAGRGSIEYTMSKSGELWEIWTENKRRARWNGGLTVKMLRTEELTSKALRSAAAFIEQEAVSV